MVLATYRVLQESPPAFDWTSTRDASIGATDMIRDWRHSQDSGIRLTLAW